MFLCFFVCFDWTLTSARMKMYHLPCHPYWIFYFPYSTKNLLDALRKRYIQHTCKVPTLSICQVKMVNISKVEYTICIYNILFLWHCYALHISASGCMRCIVVTCSKKIFNVIKCIVDEMSWTTLWNNLSIYTSDEF